MALIRRFEEEAGRQYQRAKAGGFLHLAIGEEATIVGTTSVMSADDYLIGTYRTTATRSPAAPTQEVMAELFGREDGTARGRGGSMHIFDGDRRFMGGYGIVGGNLPIAAGLDARLRLQGHRRGDRLHVRRRRLQHRQLRGDDEPRGPLAAADRLPRREQPLRDGDGDRAPLRASPTSPGRPRASASPASGSTARTSSRCGSASPTHLRDRPPRPPPDPSSRPSPTDTAVTRRPTPRSIAKAGGRGVARTRSDRDLRASG